MQMAKREAPYHRVCVMTVINVSQMCAINKRFKFPKCYYSASDRNDVKTGKIKIE